ncbi:MAG: VPLPA-CTERM sorting domain-containing protein [Gammaproteobacteria bacterium]|nr:VPLPA-CTERM sorting domain-containing protein [Gammaproteobacteria bacterium]
MKSNLAGLLCSTVLAVTAIPTQAAYIQLDLGTTFSSGAVAPDGAAPYGTIVIDDGGTSGSVTMTLTASSTIGSAIITDVYLNLDPSLDPTLLSFTYDGSSTGPAASGGGDNGISTGVDGFQADGDGLYDINFNFPPPPGSPGSAIDFGEVVIYTITSTEAITASSFGFLSAPGGGEGPFYAAAHFQKTGTNNNKSAWEGADTVTTVPVPAAVWLFGSGLIGLVGVARRKNA